MSKHSARGSTSFESYCLDQIGFYRRGSNASASNGVRGALQEQGKLGFIDFWYINSKEAVFKYEHRSNKGALVAPNIISGPDLLFFYVERASRTK